MERAILNRQFWDELMEKLRKAGGGGGGSLDFDRIKVSMQLISFLSNKTIQAMLNNLKFEVFGTSNNVLNKVSTQSNFAGNVIQFVTSFTLNIISSLIGNLGKIVNIQNISKSVTNTLSVFAGILSFQLNKLKEILLEDLKEIIRKLDVKEKIRKIKIALRDFFVELREETLSVIEFVRSKIIRCKI